jgi:hypothetical protein
MTKGETIKLLSLDGVRVSHVGTSLNKQGTSFHIPIIIYTFLLFTGTLLVTWLFCMFYLGWA